jgi:hypothetical protein
MTSAGAAKDEAGSATGAAAAGEGIRRVREEREATQNGGKTRCGDYGCRRH